MGVCKGGSRNANLPPLLVLEVCTMLQNVYIFPEETKKELEESEIPLAVYQFIDGSIVTILVSNGLIRLQEPGFSREAMIHYLDTDMYKDVHRDDLIRVVTKAKEFAKTPNMRYEDFYRIKLYGKDEYRTLHVIGYHRYLDDGTEYAVVQYDDVTEAIQTSAEKKSEVDENLMELLNADKVDPFVIIDAKNHELLMVSSTVVQVWKPEHPYTPGITFEKFFSKPNGTHPLSIDDILEKGEVIISNPHNNSDLILSASLIKWHGKDSIFLRLNGKTDRYFDPLTGLPNMEYSRMCGENFADEIRSKGGSPAIIYFDIIGMKLYNSANGFDKGNEFLIHFAACLKKKFHENLICRFSNDHFAVIADMQNIDEKLSSIREFVKQSISKISMDVNIGVCEIGEFDAILDASEKAKIACNIQKKNVGSHIRYYDEELRNDLILQNYVVNHIDEAIENDYIKVYYQPVVRTITETFCGMEALARWVDPQYGFLNPAAFIGALEESRQIHKLDSHVISLVCKELREELDKGNQIVPVSFNLSRLDFLGCDIFKVVEDALEKYKINREFIRVEITESIMASDSYVRSEIERFRLVGYEVWMDDFGSGYSSLNTLKDYKFDELKIDMAFLTNFNEKSRTIISSTVRMAKNLGLKTLAEGVETKEQMDFLKGIGCEKVQGYYYGKPAPLLETFKHMADIGKFAEDRATSQVYSKLGSLDYLVDSPKAIIAYENDLFRFLFINKQFEDQLRSLGFKDRHEVEVACNNPKDPAYYTLHEAEKAAFKAPHQMTYVSHGTFVSMSGHLVANINGCHIYDMTIRNTHVTAFDSSSQNNDVVHLPKEAKTILIADDNLQNKAFLESMLRTDYNLLFAEDGEQVLKILNEHSNHISLALIDAELPKVDGFKIIQKFHSEHRELQIPFIIMTDNMDIAKESIRLGASQFVHVPIRDKEMMKAKIDGAIKNTELLHQMALNYMEYVAGGVILFETAQKKVLYVNVRAMDIFECETLEEFNELVEHNFAQVILPEDHAKTDEELANQIQSGTTETRQITYRIKMKNGAIKRIYHVGRIFKNTPYGCIFSTFISEDDMALKDYFGRIEAFKEFMASGEATHTKSYDPGYKGFLFWNLTKNSPVLRMGGISYIPKELENNYTYDNHYKFLSQLLSKEGVDIQKASNYTREKLLRNFMNKCVVPSLSLNYHLKNGWFSIKTKFEMMADPETGDVILKAQNENVTDVEAYRELTDSVVLNMYDQILYIDGDTDSVVTLSSVEGRPMYVQQTMTDAVDNLCKIFQITLSPVGQFLDFIQSKTMNKTYGRILRMNDGKRKFVRARSLYYGVQKYIVTIADITDATGDFL